MIKWRLPMNLIVKVSFASTSESSLIFLISLLPIQTLLTIKLHQHLQWLHLTFDTALHKTWYGSFHTEKGQYHYPDHQRGQEDNHLMLWTTYQILPPLEFVYCALCSSKKVENWTYVRCTSCNIALCPQKDHNCFQQYHTKHWFFTID